MNDNPTPIKTLRITRTFQAPRELVFSMFITEKHMAQWWGPAGYTNPICQLDVRKGGELRIDMQSPEGIVIRNTGTFVEIDEPEKLVFTTAALENADGVPGIRVLNSFTFSEYDGTTEMVMTAEVMHATEAVAEGVATMEQGWNESLDRLQQAVLTTIRDEI